MTTVYIDDNIEEIHRLHEPMLRADRNTFTIIEYLGLQAERISEAHRAGDSAVCFHLACWCPPLVGTPREEIMQRDLNTDMAQLTIAREHGFTDWSAAETLGDTKFDQRFENCVDTLLVGDLETLKEMLANHPKLVHQRSQYGHGATLLHYLAANGVESYRQVTPLNAEQIAICLADAGAEVNCSANIYGGSTALELLVSSAHPANAGVTDKVAQVLRNAGAD